MKLYKENDIPDGQIAITCKENNLKHYAFVFLILTFIVSLSYLIFNRSSFIELSNGLNSSAFVIGCFSLFVLLMVILITLESLVASSKKSNWILKIHNKGLLFKFRSYLNYHFTNDNPCVVFIPKDEIISANKTIKKITTAYYDNVSKAIKKDNDKKELQYLDIIVNINNTRELNQGILNEIGLPAQKKFLLKRKYKHYPVTLIDNKVIRIEWKSEKSLIKPNLDKVLQALSKEYTIEDVAFEKVNIKPENEQEIKRLILNKAQSGDKIATIKMIREHYGYNATRAQVFLEKLLSES